MTFGGMGSQRLVGPNIEYIMNNDSHPGAPFNSEFRNLVKSEIARLSAGPAPNTAQAKLPKAFRPTKLAKAPEGPKLEVVKEERLQHLAGTTHVDALPSLVNSGSSAVQRQITIADMKDYVKRTYQSFHGTDSTIAASE